MNNLEKLKAVLVENGFEYYIANIVKGKIVSVNIWIGEDSEED